MFTASFQSSTAMSKNMEVVISALTLDPIFADELRKEVDGQASGLRDLYDECWSF